MNDNNIISTEDLIQVADGNNLYQDACAIIDSAKRYAYKQVDETLVKRNWLLGLRIQHEVLKDKRAEYGERFFAQYGAPVYFRVRKTWKDKASQLGAFRVYQNAKACADANPGYAVFNESGEQIYPAEDNEQA